MFIDIFFQISHANILKVQQVILEKDMLIEFHLQVFKYCHFTSDGMRLKDWLLVNYRTATESVGI